MCRFLLEKSAVRSYGANLPASSWGAVFPGDEEEQVCELTGEVCGECCPMDEDLQIKNQEQ